MALAGVTRLALMLALLALTRGQVDPQSPLYGVAYSPFSTTALLCLEDSEVIRDLQVVSRLSRRIRLYSVACSNTRVVLQWCLQNSMSVMLGAWITGDNAKNEEEFVEFSALVREFGPTGVIESVAVGNEAISVHGSNLAIVADYLGRTRVLLRNIPIPMTYVDIPAVWDGSWPSMAAAAAYLVNTNRSINSSSTRPGTRLLMQAGASPSHHPQQALAALGASPAGPRVDTGSRHLMQGGLGQVQRPGRLLAASGPNMAVQVLLGLVDFIGLNTHPYFDGLPVTCDGLNITGCYNSTQWAIGRVAGLTTLLGKPVEITEVGWPTQGEPCCNSAPFGFPASGRLLAVPSLPNAQTFLTRSTEDFNRAGIKVWHFESFDAAWKVTHAPCFCSALQGALGNCNTTCTYDYYWGLLQADRKVKPGLDLSQVLRKDVTAWSPPPPPRTSGANSITANIATAALSGCAALLVFGALVGAL